MTETPAASPDKPPKRAPRAPRRHPLQDLVEEELDRWEQEKAERIGPPRPPLTYELRRSPRSWTFTQHDPTENLG